MSKKIVAFSFALLLSACGYHLRGNLELPAGAENIYVEAASGALQQEMRKALKPAHGKLVDSATEAGLVIKFSKEEMDTRVMSMNTAGRANQFQLIYQLVFSIYDPKGNPVLTEQKINIKRDYFNDQTDILGKSNEESVIRVEMYQQAVSSIVSRINLALESKTKTTAAK
jgi:LPS-assembly lipoprotein